MKRGSTNRVALPILLMLLGGCKDGGVAPVDRSPGLYGQVLDQDGMPLNGAAIHYIFFTNSTPNDPVIQQVWITYGLPQQTEVSLHIYNPFSRLAATLLDRVHQPAGMYSIQFDGSTFTNGVYSYNVEATGVSANGRFFLRTDDVNQLVQTAPLVSAGLNGQFFLSPAILGIGRTFTRLTLGGPVETDTIIDSVAVVIAHPGHRTLVEGFRLDTTTAVNRTFVVTRN